VLLDPALPLGHLGPWLERPYGVVVHGAEVTVPGRVPGTRQMLARVLRDARLVVAAGGYPAAEAARAAGRDLPTVVIPPGVDTDRFHPLTPDERRAAREHLGLDPDAPVVLGLSRLVPRKGFDVLVEAAALLGPRHPGLEVVIVGAGRDRSRLERLARRHASPVRFLGRLPEPDLALVHGAADCFAMLCRDRWAGLEQEGFGIVFLEAAASGVPQVAGRSGGSAEAVLDGGTGLVVDAPEDVAAVAQALDRLLGDEALRARLGEAARRRAVTEFDYDVLARRLQSALDGLGMTS
jgi:phosphatidylinositol alpha-1,6-mannosyltransferase